MQIHTDRLQKDKGKSVGNAVSLNKSGSKFTFQLVGNQPEANALQKMHVMAGNSSEAIQLRAYQNIINSSPQTRQMAHLQAMATNHSSKQQLIQKKEKESNFSRNINIGMPDLSGRSRNDMKVNISNHIDFKNGAGEAANSAIQRLKIGNEVIRPHGQNGKALWEKTKTAMIENGLSPHGAKKVFLAQAKSNVTIDNEDTFIVNFIKAALQEVGRVEHEKKTLPKEEQTRGWTRPLKIARPSWTARHKEATKKGEDIRHVVRNATIRNALKAEFDTQMLNGADKALENFQLIATHLGIDPTATTAWELLDRIYKVSYLNFGNLFAGAGGINRVIGLTADDIYNTGAQWLGSEDTASVQELENLFDWVAQKIAEKSDQTENQIFTEQRKGKLGSEDVDRFLHGLEEFFDNISDYLIDMEDYYVNEVMLIEGQSSAFKFGGVWKSQVGRELMDIGANFGFDIPIEAVGSTHMKTLLDVETFLSSYNGGDTGSLIAVLTEFLKLQSILKETV